MRKRALVQLIAAVGLACAIGIAWAVATPRVQDVQEQQPTLEIPLYEGAQVEWEVRLATQEMPKQLTELVQALSALKVAGYTIEGERALEVLNFYDQTLNTWRKVLWVKPDESGGVRLFAQDRSYLLVIASKRYEATDLVLVTAQAEALDVPIFEGAELQWELVLTKQDLLEYLKRWFGSLITNPPAAMRMWWQPERPQDSLIEVMSWLGVFGIEALFRLLQDFSDLRVVGYKLDGNKAVAALSFYEQHFGNWTRNFWAKPEESGGMRIFSQGSAEGLKELVIVISTTEPLEVTNVIVLRARR
ncbi:MAG: hypothetical protein ACK4HB_03785 [Candidatus Bipolaricaulia bacterium]